MQAYPNVTARDITLTVKQKLHFVVLSSHPVYFKSFCEVQVLFESSADIQFCKSRWRAQNCALGWDTDVINGAEE